MPTESPSRTAPVESVEELARIAAPILRRHRTITASVFGSMARGDATPDSDVDLLASSNAGSRSSIWWTSRTSWRRPWAARWA
ncbi:MAG: nucleotidyltransferase family protein [Desulfovibrionaceae bacterium]